MNATKYGALLDTLKNEILSGKYRSNFPFPSVRALISRFKLSDRTVRHALDELYAQGLISRKQGRGTFIRSVSRKIGLIVPGIADSEFFQTIVPGLLRSCQAVGYQPVFCEITETAPRERMRQALGFARALVADRVAGVIFQPMVTLARVDANAAVAQCLSNGRIPFVLLNTDFVVSPERSAYDVVGIDNVEAGCMVGAHLISCGARRIAFLMWPDVASVRSRFRGLRLSVLDENVKTRLVEANPSNNTAIARTLRLFKPDAFVCGNDTAAAVLTQTLARLGRRVPDDVLLAGFDDIRHSTIMTPQLTSVRQPCEDIARIAIARLLLRIANPSEIPQTIRLPAPLVVRASTTRSSVKSAKPNQKMEIMKLLRDRQGTVRLSKCGRRKADA